MDVRCERCKTEYEFDDSRISEAGVTVKCTTCGHVFKVKKKALVVTVPVQPEEAANASFPGPTEKNREWKVRQANGNLFTFKELTTLQKWIVERKVSRDDEISLSGESWKRLGNIAELASFFQVVEEATRAQFTPPPQFMPGYPSTPTNVPTGIVPTPVSGSYPNPLAQAPVSGPYPVAAPPPAVVPPPAPYAPPGSNQAVQVHVHPTNPSASPEPTFTRSRPRMDRIDFGDEESDLHGAGIKKRGGALRWFLLLVFLGALGGGGYYAYFNVWLPMQQREANERAQLEKDQAEKAEREKREAEDKAKAEAEAKARAEAEAKAKEDAGAVAAAPADAGVVEAKAEKKEPRRDFDWYMNRGDRLRETDKAEEALNAYGKAADMEPDRAEPVAGRGLALLDMGQQLQAEASFQRALELNPRYGVALMGLAETYRAEGKKEDAVKYYQKYLDELPDGPEANVARTNIDRLK